jgi:hypothetical protein
MGLNNAILPQAAQSSNMVFGKKVKRCVELASFLLSSQPPNNVLHARSKHANLCNTLSQF